MYFYGRHPSSVGTTNSTQRRDEFVFLPWQQGDKLLFETEDDIDIALKALGDYYKIGEVSGKPYGTFAGKELTPAEI